MKDKGQAFPGQPHKNVGKEEQEVEVEFTYQEESMQETGVDFSTPVNNNNNKLFK